MRYAYLCELHPDDPDGFFVKFPDVRGALTGGTDAEEALAMAEDALVAMLAVHVKKGESLPTPSSPRPGQHLVPVPPLVAAKLALYTAMREQGVTAVQLARRLKISEAAVRRLVDPDYGSHLTPVMNALHAVGRGLVVEDAAPA